MQLEELIENFDFIDDWEDRYRVIIELGQNLPVMPDALKTKNSLVPGCMSQVWMVSRMDGEHLHIIADSDAAIVKGLIAVLLLAYANKTPQEILLVDIKDIFSRLNLESHLSPNRRNGFYAMVARICAMAKVLGV
ncbi:Fe-S cluster assembly protein SufE [Piscirickettsia salmonis]|uniref:Cysteine desulfuration protein SufE n=1 Tax=Piscirickettsia salmonis TaxID=1238 RepID=A0A9Q5VD76_PISSA|nr:SufE family protein [Piscirickettsia salmonis]ALA25532.1 fe-S metabolism associated domain protein [Piscirickettsia salmonis]APS43043.1 Fe-S cluster assembly protein SufE [Piscirickettsia salmonis]APS46391.1 Fe-S cluster assembly protein SufE [Piscirickettsia salmonis]APS50361.1 Fe-S cluster assembly protein SufE [Piscirickettsia salmonis]APS53560.1 Fe-S cluster assembly protein SufE [Piscirickettsia salmonis]